MGRAQQHSVQQFKRISLNGKRHRMLIGQTDERVYVAHQVRQVDGPLVGQPLDQHTEQVVQAGKGSGEFFSVFEFHGFLPSANYPLPSICVANDFQPLQNGYLFGNRAPEGFPMSRRNYKRIPTSLKGAFEQDKAQGITRGLSVERNAELHAVSASRMYKWIEEADIPANRLAAWFHHTGGRAVIRYLCAQAGGLFVPVPSGRRPDPVELAELQKVLAETISTLLRFYSGKADTDETLSEVHQALEALAWHRGNVEKHAQPEFDFTEV